MRTHLETLRREYFAEREPVRGFNREVCVNGLPVHLGVVELWTPSRFGGGVLDSLGFVATWQTPYSFKNEFFGLFRSPSEAMNHAISQVS